MRGIPSYHIWLYIVAIHYSIPEWGSTVVECLWYIVWLWLDHSYSMVRVTGIVVSRLTHFLGSGTVIHQPPRGDLLAWNCGRGLLSPITAFSVPCGSCRSEVDTSGSGSLVKGIRWLRISCPSTMGIRSSGLWCICTWITCIPYLAL